MWPFFWVQGFVVQQFSHGSLEQSVQKLYTSKVPEKDKALNAIDHISVFFWGGGANQTSQQTKEGDSQPFFCCHCSFNSTSSSRTIKAKNNTSLHLNDKHIICLSVEYRPILRYSPSFSLGNILGQILPPKLFFSLKITNY